MLSTPSTQGSPARSCFNLNYNTRHNLKRAAITGAALLGIGLTAFGLMAHFGMIAGISSQIVCGVGISSQAIIWGLIGAGLVLSASAAAAVSRSQKPIRVGTWCLGKGETGMKIAHHYSLHKTMPANLQELNKNLTYEIKTEERVELFNKHFERFDRCDIFCQQKNPQQKKGEDTQILWNAERFSLVEDISLKYLSTDYYKCVHLKEIQTGRELIVASVDVLPTPIGKGSVHLLQITQVLNETSLPVIIAGNFNAPRSTKEDSRHQIMDDAGFTTCTPGYDTHLSLQYGPVTSDFIYTRGCEVVKEVALPESLRDWAQSPSNHKPVVQEIVLG